MPQYRIQRSLIRERLNLSSELVVDYPDNIAPALDHTFLIAMGALLRGQSNFGLLTVTDTLPIDQMGFSEDPEVRKAELQTKINDAIMARVQAQETTLLPAGQLPDFLFLRTGLIGGHWQLVRLAGGQFEYFNLNPNGSMDRAYQNAIRFPGDDGQLGAPKQADLFYTQNTQEGCGVVTLLNFMLQVGFLTHDEIEKELELEAGETQLTAEAENKLRLILISIFKQKQEQATEILKQQFDENGELLAIVLSAELEGFVVEGAMAVGEAKAGDLAAPLPQPIANPRRPNEHMPAIDGDYVKCDLESGDFSQMKRFAQSLVDYDGGYNKIRVCVENVNSLKIAYSDPDDSAAVVKLADRFSFRWQLFGVVPTESTSDFEPGAEPEQQDDIVYRQASLFSHIYRALYAGQSTLLSKSNFLDAGRDETSDALLNRASLAQWQDKCVAKALELTQTHLEAGVELVSNYALITQIYKWSFENSHLLARSNVTGETVRTVAALNRRLSVFESGQIETARQCAPDSRLSKIMQALSNP